MSVVVPAETVGAKIVEWYSCIIARSIKQATEMQKEIQGMLDHMKADDRILAYYSLVEFRYNIMMNQVGKGDEDTLMLEKIGKEAEESIDHMLRYLYYFISGQNEFMHERYRSAIRLFRKAERLLEYVNDEAEEAEFHYYMGSSLYRISQYTFAGSYIEESMVAFKRLNYSERTINCKVLLAGIYSETGSFKKANEILFEALELTNTYEIANVVVLRALGINAMRHHKHEEAKKYFESVFKSLNGTNHILTMKTEYSLAHVHFFLNEIESGIDRLKMAEAGAIFYKNNEYKARCLVLRGIYVDKKEALVDEAIEQLTQFGMNFESEEVAESVAHYYEKRGNSDKELKYLKIAYKARQNLSKTGVDQD